MKGDFAYAVPGASVVLVNVEFEWKAAGDVLMVEGRLVFPKLPKRSGLYRFLLGTRAYSGETDLLPRRMNGYRNPGPTQKTNLRLNEVMIAHLGAGGSISMEIVTEGSLLLDGAHAPLDLDDKAHRVLAEQAAIIEMRARGIGILNAN